MVLLATTLGNGDYIDIGLVITLIGSVIAVQRIMHARAEEDTRRHHELDKRLTLIEKENHLAPVLREIADLLKRRPPDRDRDAGRSDIYQRDPRDH